MASVPMPATTLRSPFGVNLAMLSYSMGECPLIDRIRVAGDPLPVKGYPMPACDPVSGFQTEAGVINRQIPLDPIDTSIATNPTFHDYAIHCDPNVVKIGTAWAQITPDKDGYATMRVKSSSPDGPFQIFSKGPVSRVSVMRVEHEEAWKHGAIFNPDFIPRARPFRIWRPLDWNATNYDFGAPDKAPYPAKRPTPADGYFTMARGGFPAEYMAMLAKMCASDLWYTTHPKMSDAEFVDRAKVLAAFGVSADFEDGNELGWTFQKTWMYDQACKELRIAKADYSSVLEYYGLRAGRKALLLQPISPDFKMMLCSQGSDGPVSNLGPILKGWDKSGAPRSMIRGYACAAYLILNAVIPQLLALWKANDRNGVYPLIRSLMPKLQARYVTMVRDCRAAGITPMTYEGNIHLTTFKPDLGSTPAILALVPDQAARDAFMLWMAEILHSAQAGEIVIQLYRSLMAIGVERVMHFNFSGRENQYGVCWGAQPHITLPPYPIYNMLVGAGRLT